MSTAVSLVIAVVYAIVGFSTYYVVWDHYERDPYYHEGAVGFGLAWPLALPILAVGLFIQNIKEPR